MSNDFEDIIPLNSDVRISLSVRKRNCYFSIAISGETAKLFSSREANVAYSKSKHEVRISEGKTHKLSLKRGGTLSLYIPVPSNIDPPKDVKREVVVSRTEGKNLFVCLPWANDE